MEIKKIKKDKGKISGIVADFPETNEMDVELHRVVHAHWFWDGLAQWYMCSNCERGTNDRHDRIEEVMGHMMWTKGGLPRYCGHCGATMDEDVEGGPQSKTSAAAMGSDMNA